jgi:hypothetical protein
MHALPQKHHFHHDDFEPVQMQTSAQVIETSGADEREVAAAIIVQELLSPFEDSPEVALGFVGLLFKGNMQLLDMNHDKKTSTTKASRTSERERHTKLGLPIETRIEKRQQLS